MTFFVSFYFYSPGWPLTHYVSQTGLKLSLPSVGIIGRNHRTLLEDFLIWSPTCEIGLLGFFDSTGFTDTFLSTYGVMDILIPESVIGLMISETWTQVCLP